MADAHTIPIDAGRIGYDRVLREEREPANRCPATRVGTDWCCGVCGVQATEQTIGRWYLDEHPQWVACDLHHPYNGDPVPLADEWGWCTVHGVTYAYHRPCARVFIVPQEHHCRPRGGGSA